MTRHLEDRPKRNFRKTFTKLYKDRAGNDLNSIPSTPARTVTIKSRITRQVVGNVDADPDKFRSGVEIADPIYRMRGSVDISCGTDDHVHEQLVIGQSWETEEYSWFDETEKQFELKTIKELVSPGTGSWTTSEKIITFNRIHFSGSDGYGINVNTRQTTRNLYDELLINNGTIKVFDEIGKFSTASVEEKHMTPSTPYGSRNTSTEVISSQFPKVETAILPFTEASEGKDSTRVPLKGTELKVGKLTIRDGNDDIKFLSTNARFMVYNNKLISRDTLYVEPLQEEYFDDSAQNHRTARTSDNMDTQLKNVLLQLTGSGDTGNYVGDTVKTATTGYVNDSDGLLIGSLAFR